MIGRKKRKHCVREGKPLRVRSAANQEWALDFVHDAVECARTIRVLSVVDAYTRECLAFEVDTSFASRRVTRVLEQIVAQRGQPQAIRCDRSGVDQPALPGVMRGAADRTAAHSARKAHAECACRELLWTAARRVLERKLVPKPVRCAVEDHSLAKGVQRRTPAQQLGMSDTE
jgi:hypothetical protein